MVERWREGIGVVAEPVGIFVAGELDRCRWRQRVQHEGVPQSDYRLFEISVGDGPELSY
jgi:hypothetical protein